MMEFIQFASQYGLVINSLIPDRWVRVPTTDKPRSRNGAYFYARDYAVVQNWAQMDSAVVWQDKTERTPFDQAAISKRIEQSRKEQAKQLSVARLKAAHKARWIISQVTHEQHAYLDKKSFPESVGLVWRPDEDANLLVVPMYANREIVGCQLINRDGEKRFLTGQQTIGAEHVLGTSGIDLWCEGYATGLSIHACLMAIKIPAKVHVCFSAGNLQKMASSGFVIADNDASQTGQNAAQATNLPWYMPDVAGQDFNDEYAHLGKFSAAMKLKQALIKKQHRHSTP